MLNRAAAICRYRQAFVDWINATDPASSPPVFDLAHVNQESTVYLVDVEELREFDDSLEANHREVFENELHGWYTDPDLWPEDRSLATLRDWCTFELHSVVVDMGGRPLEDDELFA